MSKGGCGGGMKDRIQLCDWFCDVCSIAPEVLSHSGGMTDSVLNASNSERFHARLSIMYVIDLSTQYKS
jgi:hypothetical protein